MSYRTCPDWPQLMEIAPDLQFKHYTVSEAQLPGDALVNLDPATLEEIEICCDLERHVYYAGHTHARVVEALAGVALVRPPDASRTPRRRAAGAAALSPDSARRPVVRSRLSGGVGGARFLRGLVEVVEPSAVTVIGNVGDDVEVLGLHVSPDLDSILYALAGVADEERGWGRADETWQAMEVVSGLGGEAWFQLGDRDLGLHLVRTQALRERRAALGGDRQAGQGSRRRGDAAARDRRRAADVDRHAGRLLPVPGVVRRASAPGRGRPRALRRRGDGDACARRARRARRRPS